MAELLRVADPGAPSRTPIGHHAAFADVVIAKFFELLVRLSLGQALAQGVAEAVIA